MLQVDDLSKQPLHLAVLLIALHHSAIKCRFSLNVKRIIVGYECRRSDKGISSHSTARASDPSLVWSFRFAPLTQCLLLIWKSIQKPANDLIELPGYLCAWGGGAGRVGLAEVWGPRVTQACV